MCRCRAVVTCVWLLVAVCHCQVAMVPRTVGLHRSAAVAAAVVQVATWPLGLLTARQAVACLCRRVVLRVVRAVRCRWRLAHQLAERVATLCLASVVALRVAARSLLRLVRRLRAAVLYRLPQERVVRPAAMCRLRLVLAPLVAAPWH